MLKEEKKLLELDTKKGEIVTNWILLFSENVESKNKAIERIKSSGFSEERFLKILSGSYRNIAFSELLELNKIIRNK